MDPFSITSAVVTALGAAEAVISVCCDYRSSIKGSSWEVSRILEDTRALRNVLRILEGLADEAETSGSTEQNRLSALESLCDPDTGVLNSCCAELEKLNTKLAPPAWSGPPGSKRRGLVEALSWPLKREDTEKILKSMERVKTTINIALNADQRQADIASLIAVEKSTQYMEMTLRSSNNDTLRCSIRNWLRPTDQDQNTFNGWKKDRNSFLWLSGILGCGKTVLCLTAIENALEERSAAIEEQVAVGFFYFEFSNQDQQLCDTMLRSLIFQFWSQSRKHANALDALYSDCGSGASQPSLLMLKNALRELVHSFPNVFIFLDALDECRERVKLMQTIEGMAEWNIPSLHILATSREERDIEQSLSKFLDDSDKIRVQSALVEEDIRAYVRSRIRNDPELKKWQKPEVQSEIETVLMAKANGMFQWVKCQLDALGRCLSLSHLRTALRSLPKDLDDTYARILQCIDNEGYGKEVAKIMQWLAYSRRPMSLTEVSEVLTVDPEDDAQFDIERRLVEPHELLRMCSSLVTTVRQQRQSFRKIHEHAEGEELLQLAHYSVREYLESARLLEGPAKSFAIHEMRANIFIAESCIIYLLQFDPLQTTLETCSVSHVRNEYPLAKYAATSWYIHSQRAEEGGNIIALCRSLLMSEGYAPVIAIELRAHSGGLRGRGENSWLDARGRPLPLQIALRFHLPNVTKALIMSGADVNLRRRDGWTPLMEVSNRPDTHLELVQLFLKNGAEVNAQDDNGWTALMGAAYYGKLQMVRVLLDHGADIGLRSGEHRYTALNLAATRHFSELVEHLLDRGVPISSSDTVEALQMATCSRNHEILHMVLGRGVDVDAELLETAGFWKYLKFKTALLLALNACKNAVRELLLAHGADVNARSTIGGNYGVGLEHALNHGKDYMLEFLLEHGADPDLVNRENLNEDGTRRYEELLSRIKNEDQHPSRVQEVEMDEQQADG